MATIDAFRSTFRRDEPWPIAGAFGFAAVLSFIFQAVPLAVLIDMPAEARQAVVILTPLLAGVFAAGVAYSHNKRLRWLAGPARD